MFSLFYHDFKYNIYDKIKRKLKKREIALLIILGVSWLSLCISSFRNLGNQIIIILSMLVIISLIACEIYVRKLLKSTYDERFERHQQILKALNVLLKNKKYNLYTISGVEWLIECIRLNNNERNSIKFINSSKNLFFSIIFPIITLTYGFIISKISFINIMNYSVLLIVLIGLIIIAALFFKDIYSIIFENNNIIYESLLNNLLYIRTQLKKDED